MNKISGILMLLIYVCVATTLLNDAFVSPFNMQNIVRWSSLFGIIGIGVAFVIITGGIDLSIGSVIGLVGSVLPILIMQRQWSVPAALAAVMSLALGIGLLHGLLVTRMRLQPFVVTLCGLLFYRGLARWITNDKTQGFSNLYDNSLRLIAIGKPCSVAFVLLVAGLVCVVWGLTLVVLQRRQPRDSAHTADAWFLLIVGAAAAVIGSSRFWFGYDVTVQQTLFSLAGWKFAAATVEVPPAGAEMPGTLLRWCGVAFLPAAVWFTVAVVRRDERRQITWPLVAVAVTSVVLYLAMHSAAHLSFTGRMAAIFGGLGLLMGALGWFGSMGLRIGGAAVRLPIMIAGASAIAYLVGRTSLGKTLVPAPFFIMAILAAISAVFLNLTIYGRYLLALGRNEEAARFSGIKTDRMVLLAYVLCSGAAGLGGILFTLDGNSVQPSGHGSVYELYGIAAAVLGGCSLRGGEGSILGVVIGAAVMRVLYNSINLLGIPSQLEYTIIGMVILAGAFVDELVKRIAARRRMMARM